jgi:hypothetical protein
VLLGLLTWVRYAVVTAYAVVGPVANPLPGTPEPTGRACDLPGIDVITIGEGGITSVVGYFDQKTFVEQLGLQVIVVPANEPPMLLGMSARTDLENPTVPGALAMTWIDVDSMDQQVEVHGRTREVLQGFARSRASSAGSVPTPGCGAHAHAVGQP